MNIGKTLFAQLMDFLPWSTFARIVARYGGDARVRTLCCAEQYRAMAFAQLTYRESLRDIEVCLSARASKLYHIGFREPVRRSTLADANETRDWRIYAEFAHRLIAHARKLYASESLGMELANTVYALDSTTIDLCLSLFPWAHFRSTKAAVKMHTLLDLRGNIPSFVHISNGKLHDVHALDLLIPEQAPSTSWIAATSTSRAFTSCIRLAPSSSPVPSRTWMRTASTRRRQIGRPVSLPTRLSHWMAILPARTIPFICAASDFKDAASGKRLVFLTNHFTLPAALICDLYKSRWQVELFFKWIKQHLRIKQFYGTSDNAVRTQIWIAVSVYVLVAIVKKRLGLEASLYTLLQVFSVTLFEKMPMTQAFSESTTTFKDGELSNQLNLFDY